MNNHALVTGKSGSGKTTALLTMIAESKIPFIIIDPKGDLLQIVKHTDVQVLVPSTHQCPNFFLTMKSTEDKMKIFTSLTDINFSTEEKTRIQWLLEQFESPEKIDLQHPAINKPLYRKITTVLNTSAYKELQIGYPAEIEDFISKKNLFTLQFLTVEKSIAFVDSLLSSVYYYISRLGSTETPRLGIYIDEAAFFCPPKQEPLCKQIIKLIASRGRSLGIELTLATQAITEIDVKVANNMGTFYFGKSESIGDLRRVQELFKIPDLNLQRGEFWRAREGEFTKLPARALPSFLISKPLTLIEYTKSLPKPLYSHARLGLESYPTESMESFSERVRTASEREIEYNLNVNRMTLQDQLDSLNNEKESELKKLLTLRQNERSQRIASAASFVGTAFALFRGRAVPVTSITSNSLKQVNIASQIKEQESHIKTLLKAIKEIEAAIKHIEIDKEDQIRSALKEIVSPN